MSFIICKEVLIVTYLMSAILGLVQGVAEFLPISSSGHLTLLQHFFGMEEPTSCSTSCSTSPHCWRCASTISRTCWA